MVLTELNTLFTELLARPFSSNKSGCFAASAELYWSIGLHPKHLMTSSIFLRAVVTKYYECPTPVNFKYTDKASVGAGAIDVVVQ
jgi:hypothetical protein